MRTVFLALALIMMTAGIAAADCGDAVDQYNSALSEIDYQMNSLNRCVASSQGEDDCSSQFGRLRSAHSDFEAAVSGYQDECDQ